jgi:hypothetical protein
VLAVQRVLRAGWLREILAVLILSGLLGVITLYVGLRSPGEVAFGVDRIPVNVIQHNVLELEQDGTTPVRWTRPRALLGVPVGGPARYRITLQLADSAQSPPGRQVHVSANGQALGVATLTPSARDFTFSYDFTPHDWGTSAQGAIYLLLEAPPFTPPGETRVLGPQVRAVAIEPLFTVRPLLRPNWFLLFGPSLAFLLLTYAALRLFGVSGPRAAIAVGALLAGYAILAIFARDDALFLAYQPVAQPARFALLLSFIALSPWVARPIGRRTSAPLRGTSQGI